MDALSRLFPLGTLMSRALDLAAVRTSKLGERHGVNWLTYNPLQMLAYHRLAMTDAAAVIAALEEVFPDARCLADVGAGSGAYAAEAVRRGHGVEACEFALGGRLMARWQGVPTQRLDLRRDPPASFRRGIDLAYCFEVAEHCPPELGDRLVRFLARLAPNVVFTAAQPGQVGLGHINAQDREYWIDRFTGEGAEYCGDAVASLREAFARHGVEAPWFHNNVTVFRQTVKSNVDEYRICG